MIMDAFKILLDEISLTEAINNLRLVIDEKKHSPEQLDKLDELLNFMQYESIEKDIRKLAYFLGFQITSSYTWANMDSEKQLYVDLIKIDLESIIKKYEKRD